MFPVVSGATIKSDMKMVLSSTIVCFFFLFSSSLIEGQSLFFCRRKLSILGDGIGKVFATLAQGPEFES